MRTPLDLCCCLLPIATALLPVQAWPDTRDIGTVQGERVHFRSSYLDAEIVVLPGVFHPEEAEQTVLPLMSDHSDLFGGKAVLEIGTGSGIISLYAAKLGAKHIVATDINEAALASAERNAQRLGFSSVLETRLVPSGDASAYSVIGSDEGFDIIISNPPYSLDLDAPRNDAVTDTGDLGFSIVRGLDDHLRPGGVAVLLYASLFYHEVMVKFARYMGYEVRHDKTTVLAPFEAQSLFNAYLSRLLQRERVDAEAFRFDWNRDETLQLWMQPDLWSALDRLRWVVLGTEGAEREPLFPGGSSKRYPGFMVIRRSGERRTSE